jgi:hypothetical protein
MRALYRASKLGSLPTAAEATKGCPMSEILQSLKSDLLDRRLLPVLLLLGAALAGAVAYAVLAGGSSAKPVATLTLPPGAGGAPVNGPTLPVQQVAASPNAAAAETTDGARYQHKPGAHNPFIPLASPKAKTAAASSASSSKTPASSPSPASSPAGKSGSSTPSSSSSGGGTTPSQPAPRKPKAVHKLIVEVGVLFGPAPTVPGQLSQLTPYASVKRLEPLPSTTTPLIVFQGLASDKKSAIFALSREAILKGEASCLPNAFQCESIELKAGQAEELSFLNEASGQTAAYELVLQSIAWHETTTTTTARIARRHRHDHRRG